MTRLKIKLSHSMPRQYYRVLQDDEIPASSNYSRTGSSILSGLPAVMRVQPFHNVPLDSARQHFWFGLNNSWRGLLEEHKAWRGYTGNNLAFCNNNGIWDINQTTGEETQKRRDYIDNSGAGLPNPVMFTLICVNDVLCGEEVTLTERVGDDYPAGLRVLKLEYIDVNEPLPFGNTNASHPHLIGVAKTILPGVIAPNGFAKVNAFPHRGGREGLPVFIPHWAREQIYYRMDRLQKMPLGYVPTIGYNPL